MSERVVDLRSDTITLPTAAMREAMARAEVGDDVYGEDPTVERLQEMAAERMGMEAALYVPSGTMGNTCALLAHTRPGEEVVLDELAHIYNWECGNYAVVAGLAARLVPAAEGIMAPEGLEAAFRPSNMHYPETRLVCIENTHNNAAGAAWTPEQVAAIGAVTGKHGVLLHMDGARIFNAAVAVGVDVRDYTRHVDSVSFCLSKGLSAPVGSLLCGTRLFIERARGMRKRLGGAMRQAGIIAAAGIVALEQQVDHLTMDHENARRLADGLGKIPGFEVVQPPIPTNILIVEVAGLGWSSEQLIEKWKRFGIRCNPRPPSRVRLVTHRHISAADVTYVLEVTRQLAAEG